jgi:hypothetical protein
LKKIVDEIEQRLHPTSTTMASLWMN